jgi:2-C-methyl-D-erythritol 4-phosphate cytidylyltransferase
MRKDPIPALTKGDIVVIGDAAHPMLPRELHISRILQSNMTPFCTITALDIVYRLNPLADL